MRSADELIRPDSRGTLIFLVEMEKIRPALNLPTMGLFSTSLKKSGILTNATDAHCHILPGVDDGVKKLSETLKILADYEQLGISRVWLTPHIMEDVPNKTDFLRQRFEELRNAYNGPITLNLAAENMMDSLFDKRLKNNDLLPIGDEKDMLLVETSYYTPPYGLKDILHNVQKAGLHPLLAHPERYRYMELDDYDQLHEMGVRMQLNLTSLAGLYGPDVRKRALHLLDKEYYFTFGTDLHRHRTILDTIQASIPKKALKTLKSISSNL